MSRPEWKPARGYTWEPFKPGNTVGLRHGAFSNRVVQEEARPLIEWAYENHAWLSEADEPTVVAWAESFTACHLLLRHLVETGGLTNNAKGGNFERWRGLLRETTRLGESLGFSPLSRSRLGRNVTAAQFDLARLMSAMEDEEGEDR